MPEGACGAEAAGRACGAEAAAGACGEEDGACGADADAGAGVPGDASVQAATGTAASTSRMMDTFENIVFPFSPDSTHARGKNLAQ
jgi:hypothetical protein